MTRLLSVEVCSNLCLSFVFRMRSASRSGGKDCSTLRMRIYIHILNIEGKGEAIE